MEISPDYFVNQKKKEVFVISVYVLKVKIKQLYTYKYVNIYVIELKLLIFKIPVGKELR